MRKIVMLLGAMIGAAACAGGALAQGFPNRTVRIVVPYGPGGGVSILAQLVGQKMQEILKQPVVVDNRPGAGGNLGADLVAKSPPDGYTLLFGTIQTHGVNPALVAKLAYDPVKDFVAVAPATTFPFLLVVTPSLPVSNVAELIALARQKPGTLNYSSAGTGTGTHLAGELLKSMGHVDITHVPYKGGGDALTDVIAGRVEMTFVGIPAALPFIKAGKLRALAVSGMQRLADLPSVPTVAETLPGFDVSSWNGFFAPAGTSPAIVMRLNDEIEKIVRLPDVRRQLATLGADPFPGTPEQFATYERDEIVKWGGVVKAAGIKAE
jgi:tripartite-type tricarboxylate transporter receptor subunit TctC